nr:MAG TPA: hypothetical protein [Herelleviridae sp.]
MHTDRIRCNCPVLRQLHRIRHIPDIFIERGINGYDPR